MQLSNNNEQSKIQQLENTLQTMYDRNLNKGDVPNVRGCVNFGYFSLKTLTDYYDKDLKEALKILKLMSRYANVGDSQMELARENALAIVREYFGELGRLFIQMDQEIQKLRECIISNEDLRSLVDVLTEIYGKGEAITVTLGYMKMENFGFPVEYERRLDQWEAIINDPAEQRQRDIEKERERKAAMEQLQLEVIDLEAKTTSFEAGLEADKEALTEYTVKLNEVKGQYPSNRERIVKSSELKISVIKDKISVIRGKKVELVQMKANLELSLSKTFALALGKKHNIRDQLENVNSTLAQMNSDERRELAALEVEEDKKNKQIKKLDAEMGGLSDRVLGLDKKIRDSETRLGQMKHQLTVSREKLDNLKSRQE